MADVLMWALIILTFYIVTVAYWVGAFGLARESVERSAVLYRRAPWKSLLAGFLVSVPLLAVGVALASGGAAAGKTLGILLLFFFLLAGFFGSSGLCLLMGRGLNSVDDDKQPWVLVKRGGIVLGFMSLFPVLGWFFVLPLSLISGVGVFVLGWWGKRREDKLIVPENAHGEE